MQYMHDMSDGYLHYIHMYNYIYILYIYNVILYIFKIDILIYTCILGSIVKTSAAHRTTACATPWLVRLSQDTSQRDSLCQEDQEMASRELKPLNGQNARMTVDGTLRDWINIEWRELSRIEQNKRSWIWNQIDLDKCSRIIDDER